jgi:hypothetical protein
MSAVDPDPYEPGEGRREADDPTQGGKQGEIGTAPSIAADQPGIESYPVGGGDVTEEPDAVPVADTGPDA